jgi:hypothetical protein
VDAKIFDIFQSWYADNTSKIVNKIIKADTYYPIRILWGNTEGAGFLNLQIYGPDGQKLSGSRKGEGSYLMTSPCGSDFNPH